MTALWTVIHGNHRDIREKNSNYKDDPKYSHSLLLDIEVSVGFYRLNHNFLKIVYQICQEKKLDNPSHLGDTFP